VTTFLIFLLAYTLSQFYRAFLAVIAPELARDLSLTASDLGTMSALWFGSFALAQFPVGWALDRYGPRRTVPLMMLAAVVGSLLFSTARDRWDCMWAMVLIGVGCAPIYMGALYVFGRIYPAKQFALLSSWLIGIGSIGNLLSATPLAFASEEIGWRATFALIMGITAFAVLLLILSLRDPPKADSHEDGDTGFLAGILEVLSIRQLWPLLPLVTFSYAVMAAERGLWVGPYFAEVYKLDPIERGNATLVFAIALSAGALLYGPLDQMFKTRKWITVLGSLLTTLGFGALAVWPSPAVSTSTSLLAFVGVTGMTYAVLMAHGRSFLPDHLLGRGITFLNFLFIGGTVLIQLVSGWYVDLMRGAGRTAVETYSYLHLGFAACLLVTTLIYLSSRDAKSA
jgi:sugar phosphate permease